MIIGAIVIAVISFTVGVVLLTKYGIKRNDNQYKFTNNDKI